MLARRAPKKRAGRMPRHERICAQRVCQPLHARGQGSSQRCGVGCPRSPRCASIAFVVHESSVSILEESEDTLRVWIDGAPEYLLTEVERQPREDYDGLVFRRNPQRRFDKN